MRGLGFRGLSSIYDLVFEDSLDGFRLLLSWLRVRGVRRRGSAGTSSKQSQGGDPTLHPFAGKQNKFCVIGQKPQAEP